MKAPAPRSGLSLFGGRHSRVLVMLNRVIHAIGGNAGRLTLGVVALMALVGWVWLIAAVAGAGMPAAAGPGMPALAAAMRALLDALPWLGSGDHGLLMPAMSAWGAGDIALVFGMWVAMVLAMMLPTAAPTFRLYAARAGVSALAVVAGYTLVWIGASLVGTAGQALLTRLGALAPHMTPAGAALSASILIAAGIYQFTPLKWACLYRCRNPRAADLDGTMAGAFRIGIEEGFACLGCCWAMMAAMFAAGMMNLVAMALLGALMGFEKLVSGMKTTYFFGVLLILTGVILASGIVIG